MKLHAIRAAGAAIPRSGRTLERLGIAGLPALYRQHLAVETRPEWVEPRINALQIEPTKRCNQKCPMCTQPTLTKEQKGDMTFAQFRTIVDQMPDLTELKLQGLGEIMLNKDIWSMLEYASERRIRVLFADNALLMTEARSRSRPTSISTRSTTRPVWCRSTRCCPSPDSAPRPAPSLANRCGALSR